MKFIGLTIGLVMMSEPLWAEARSPLRTQPRAIPVEQSQVDGMALEPVEASAVPQLPARAQAAPLELPEEAALPGAPVLVVPGPPLIRPKARAPNLPRTRWQHMAGNALWTRTALAALKAHGKPLVDMVPGDIETWCPAYPKADDRRRRAFWVGFLSALAKHESTYKPWAVGGGGRWYGLLQILPGTARGYKCNVGDGAALKSGAANLSCAVRIMAHTVPRDGVISGARGNKGVGADWGPMRSAAKRREMAGWLRQQAYCKPINATRPRARP
ncbi:transglycosylase SLT domain-containing protein [Sulfitobacter sp. PR48]|uniref:transglycosylase SLT domain-containing protein n=1 Tax=Sulfitobacter sp. PR48 TaxID=3028383 RepID=UPI00237C0148|nr:transglycosylase SLT domain-containing protein [Sulfitobacter sp. PR48]MDD9721261.1 transglycosylase SLT domain-containing protein [Sulfitobacter sp. PR48]